MRMADLLVYNLGYPNPRDLVATSCSTISSYLGSHIEKMHHALGERLQLMNHLVGWIPWSLHPREVG